MTLFNSWGERERRLAAAARRLTGAVDGLLSAFAAAAPAASPAATGSCGEDASVGGGVNGTLAAFEASWVEYLGLFAVWKGQDAAALEVRQCNACLKLRESRTQIVETNAIHDLAP